MRFLTQLLCTLLAALSWFGLSTRALHAGDTQALRIVALGDMPYGDPGVVYPPYEALIDAINTRAPDLVIHVGDTKGGGACSDQVLREQLDYMNEFAAPVIYTPGDNEWTDCHRWGNDPLDRLALIRATYFAEPGTSLGQRALALEHQGAASYPENTRTRLGNVGVIAAHVVGSNNGFEARDMTAAEEFFARSAASTAWMEQSFAAFADADAIVLAIHADMFEFDFNEFGHEDWLRHSGFGAFGEALKTAARDFGKPVLLIFGDSHRHRVFQPFTKDAPNVTAMEVYGHPDMDAVAITIRPDSQSPFGFTRVENPY